MQSARLTPPSALAAACAGAAAWVSLGTLALSDASARAVRAGLLPPLWWLGVLVAGAVAAAWALRVSSDRARPLFFSLVLFLPWLPVRLPAAAMLWTGPVVWFVWAAIAASLTAGGFRAAAWPRTRGALTNPARAPWVAFACAAIVYNAAAWRAAALVPGGDEPHYLVIAQSVWRDGDLRIENNHQRGDYLEYFGGALRPDYLKRGTDGQIYSIHLPGLPAAIAPVLALGGYSLVKAFLALVSALATAMAWRTAYLVTGSAAAAWFGWAGTALAAPVLLLAFTVYPDGPGAVVVMFAFGMVAALQHRASRPGWWWAVAGALPASLPWLHPRFSVLAAAAGLILAGRALRDWRPVRSLAGLLAVPIASAAGWFGYYYAIYGRFDPSAAYGHYTQMSLGNVPTGVLGLLVDQQYGLMIYAPVFAIGVAGFAALARSHQRLAFEWFALVVPYVVVTAMYHMWWGGFSSPARFIGATLLVFAVPLAAAWASARQSATRTVQAVALGVSVGTSVMVLAAERGEFAFNVRSLEAPWLAWASQTADLPRMLPSLFRHGPLIALAEAGVWAAALAVAWLAARRLARAGSFGPGTSALTATCAIGVGVMVSASAAWRVEGVSGTRATMGQLRALQAAGTARGACGVVIESLAVTNPASALARLRVGAEPASGTSDDHVWLALPYLPAGGYRLWADLSAATTFEADLVAGRSDDPFDSWSIAVDSAGVLSRDLALPVGVSGIRVRGRAGARPAVRGIWFQPAFADDRPRPLHERRAAGARRYGRMTVYAVGGVYLEPGGLWTAGGLTAELGVRVAQGERVAAFTMRAGPAGTRLRVGAGAFGLEAELEPGEERALVIPVSQEGTALITIWTGRGFRPADVDSSSADRRLLGVRLEPR